MEEGNRRVGLQFGILLLFGFFASAQLCAASDPVRDLFFLVSYSFVYFRCVCSCVFRCN